VGGGVVGEEMDVEVRQKAATAAAAAGGGERAPNKNLLHAEEDDRTRRRAGHWRQLTYFYQFIFRNLFVLPPYLATL
jgi:hypothetical protein